VREKEGAAWAGAQLARAGFAKQAEWEAAAREGEKNVFSISIFK
jgi:hypothetical protein